ncbi:MFS transporter [Thermococcus aciditolerans]|uniref:MFS transporter n=1 Tax=Thermococcus aciditolerans TaxID=2598455 RepID=A0A5C0SK73_9EURY|nr:MFS transporter [Thermococcus aciditolerans]QEK14127.1 MFS transporter [Thermococcus aciditolerans]
MDYVKRFYLAGFFYLALYTGFYQVYLQSLGLSKGQIGLLMGIMLFLVAFLEVPTGVVADKVSKKTSVLMARTLSLLFLFILYSANSFADLLLATIISALSTAFATGAETGWLYELLKEDGRTDEYPKAYGRLRAFETVGGFAGTLAGGVIADVYGMRLPIILSAPFILASLLVLATIPKDTARSGLSYGHHLLESLRFVWNSRDVRWLFIYANIMGLPLTLFTAFMQLYFYGFLASVLAVSWVMALYMAISSASWYFDAGDSTRKRIYSYAGIVIPLLSFLAGLNGWLGFATLVLGTFIFSQAFKEWQGRFQSAIPDEKRATVGSLYSLMAAVANGVLNVILGWLFDYVGIMRGILLASALFLGLGILAFIRNTKDLQNSDVLSMGRP